MIFTSQPLRATGAGQPIQLVVLCDTESGFVGIDTTSGALCRTSVRAVDPDAIPPSVFEVVHGEIAESEIDPAFPEALLLERTPQVIGSCPPRTAAQMLRVAEATSGRDILGGKETVIPYHLLDGSHPSVAVVRIDNGYAVVGLTLPHSGMCRKVVLGRVPDPVGRRAHRWRAA